MSNIVELEQRFRECRTSRSNPTPIQYSASLVFAGKKKKRFYIIPAASSRSPLVAFVDLKVSGGDLFDGAGTCCNGITSSSRLSIIYMAMARWGPNRGTLVDQ